nr:Chain B, Major curlin subunit [Escherichia coli K-12]
IYQYGG